MSGTLKPLAVLVLCVPAFADPVNLNCTPPTQNTDGTELTDLAGIRFYESSTQGGPYAQVGDQPDCSLTLERGPGVYYYVATAYNAAGTESDYSNEAVKTISSGPEPPTGLTADAGAVAYTLQQITDGLVMYPTALVKEQTECDPYVKISTANYPTGLSLIPKASVEFPPGVQARTLYAACSGG